MKKYSKPLLLVIAVALSYVAYDFITASNRVYEESETVKRARIESEARNKEYEDRARKADSSIQYTLHKQR